MDLKELYRQPGHLIRRAHQLAGAAFVIETKEYGLTAVQFAALVAIRENPDTDATRVAEFISFDRTTIGQVLARLEGKELITRQPGIDDRRTKRLRVTPKGEAAIDGISAAAPDIAERILEPLSPSERELLLSLLARLVNVALDRPGKAGTVGQTPNAPEEATA